MENIIERLDAEVERLHKEDKNKHITYLRKKAIENLGVKTVNPYTKKGYIEPVNCLRWGSRAGYDSMYFIKMEVEKC